MRARLGAGNWRPSLSHVSPTPSHTHTHTQSTNPVTDEELEARLAKLRTAKGATPQGEGAKERRGGPAPSSSTATKAPAAPKPAVQYDFTNETVRYEGPPHRGDLATNLALGTTLVWLPLTAAAVGRAAFVKYRFTDKRFSVITTAPWKSEQTDIAYQEVKDVVTVPRGVGLWGDMVVTLRNGDKVELRSLDQFKELKAYILDRRDALGGGGGNGGQQQQKEKAKVVSGNAARVAALTDLDTPLPSEGGSKGFSS